jgi:OmpA-OmpF porin, OOP family
MRKTGAFTSGAFSPRAFNPRALILGLVLAAGSAGAAWAQPAYSATDIVKHFAPGLGSPGLGATRGLCVGTEAECNVSAPPVKAVEAFDLVVTFDHNSAVLTAEARRNLDEFAKALKDPTLSARAFEVDGHTDATGTHPYNVSLSSRRADAVLRYLKEKGVDTSRLVARGYGETRPRVASDPFDPSNRRVETRLREK